MFTEDEIEALVLGSRWVSVRGEWGMGGGDPVSLSVRIALSSFPMGMRTKCGQRVVILLTFIKKTQKTPDQELKLAKARAKEVE